MTKQQNPAVRLFASSAPQDSRPTIDTPSGPIYAGTPQAQQWQAMSVWADPLIALAASLATRTLDKAELIAAIAAILPTLPEDQASTAATLYDLSEAQQDRLSNRTMTNFIDVGGARAYHEASLRGHAGRARDALASLAESAPRPPHPDAREPAPVQPLGSDPAWRMR